VKLSDQDIADFEVLRHVTMATIFGFLYMGCTLAPPGEYDLTVRVRRRCGLMSNYFDHLFYLFLYFICFCHLPFVSRSCFYLGQSRDITNVI